MGSTDLIDRSYSIMARSRLLVRAAVRVRGIATAVLGKRLAPSTLPGENGEHWLLGQLGDEVRVVVDVGANVGDWSAAALQSWPGLERLVCFEPVGWAARELESRLGGDSRLTLVRRALTDHAGALALWEEPVGGTMSSAVAGVSGSQAVCVTVEAAILDEELERLGLERIDVLKVDAEGMDLHVLRGAARTLEEQRVDVVQFEYGAAWQHAGSTLHAAYDLLGSAGYRTLVLTPRGLCEFPLASMSELYVYANFVALSPRAAARFAGADAVW